MEDQLKEKTKRTRRTKKMMAMLVRRAKKAIKEGMDKKEAMKHYKLNASQLGLVMKKKKATPVKAKRKATGLRSVLSKIDEKIANLKIQIADYEATKKKLKEIL